MFLDQTPIKTIGIGNIVELEYRRKLIGRFGGQVG